MRLLIVDDHQPFRAQLRRMLENQVNLEVEEATSGKEGVQRALELHPAVVLMDIAMPDMNGIEATAEIKRRLPDTRVITLTIHDNPEYRKAMLAAGSEAYILKQDLPDELIEAICKNRAGCQT